jgi:hypothetical protein
MRTITRYACEICGSEFDSEAEAHKCEAAGFPEPMPFLALGVKVPAFGENGVEWAEITGVYISGSSFRPGDHSWICKTDPDLGLSHNRGYDFYDTPASAFDPRRGWDAFRYTCTTEDAAAWRAAMRDYGFKEEEASEYVLSNVRAREGQTR